MRITSQRENSAQRCKKRNVAGPGRFIGAKQSPPLMHLHAARYFPFDRPMHLRVQTESSSIVSSWLSTAIPRGPGGQRYPDDEVLAVPTGKSKAAGRPG